ncbi:outer membrane beta-barrel protein [Bacteroidales bacterium AH-315-I05]|nr:outer membrane beta-barrel protein [Bacteroidales bacterium AH-315-I05]
MKKITTLLLAIAFVSTTFAQDNGDYKKFRFGLKGVPSLNWYKPDDAKKFENAGIKFGFGWGLITEFALGENAVFATGMEIDYDKAALSFVDTAYYVFADDELVKHEEIQKMFDDTTAVYDIYKLNERSYNVTYVTLPLTLKMRTKEIGYMRYFGHFGLNTSFKTKTRSDDKVQLSDQSTGKLSAETTLEDLDITDDMQLFRLQLTIGGGAEYNLSGSTSLIFGLNYNYGFSNSIRKESRYVYDLNSSGKVEGVEQKAYPYNVALTVGIVF